MSETKEVVVMNESLVDKLNDVLSLFQEINNRKKYLIERSTELDKKICDIMHCAEFYELDAYRGYKLYKILHETRVERRNVKNELESVMGILSKVSVANVNSAKQLCTNAYRERKYTPRVVEELFDLFKEEER